MTDSLTDPASAPQIKQVPFPELPCARCQYTGRVVVTYQNVTTLADKEVVWYADYCHCSFCGKTYPAKAQEGPPLPANYTPPQDPTPTT